jgi:hypothetical protein
MWGKKGVKGRIISGRILKKLFQNEDWINLALQNPLVGFCEQLMNLSVS